MCSDLKYERAFMGKLVNPSAWHAGDPQFEPGWKQTFPKCFWFIVQLHFGTKVMLMWPVHHSRTIDWFWLPIFRTNIVRGPWNTEIKFQNKGAVQIAPWFIWIVFLFSSQPRIQNQSYCYESMFSCALATARNNWLEQYCNIFCNLCSTSAQRRYTKFGWSCPHLQAAHKFFSRSQPSHGCGGILVAYFQDRSCACQSQSVDDGWWHSQAGWRRNL